QCELQRVFAAEQEDADAPRVRQRQQHALRLKAVGLVVALARHAAVGVKVAVLSRDELTEAREILDGRTAVEVVTGRVCEANELRKADEPERVQVLVRRRCLVGPARAEAVAAEQSPL